MRDITIFAPSHETHSSAKILFAVGEKDGRAKTAANENIRNEFIVCHGRAVTNE
jgi:hypothetical protein